MRKIVLFILLIVVEGVWIYSYISFSRQSSPPEMGAIETQMSPRECWENLSEIFILDEAGTFNSCSVYVFRIRYVGPKFIYLDVSWDSQTRLIEKLDPGEKFTIELSSDYVKVKSTFYYVKFQAEFCLCEPNNNCRIIVGTLEFYCERFGDTLQPLNITLTPLVGPSRLACLNGTDC